MNPSDYSPPGVRIDMPGQMGPKRPLGGWPNLIEVANMAIQHFNEICDPNYSYLSYVGASLGLKTPAFEHTWCDWTEASSYALPGRIAARRLSGNTSGAEVEIGQRKLTLAAFHNLDGFVQRNYVPGWSEEREPILWEQARALYTLMAWFVESPDEEILSYVRAMLLALRRSSRVEGKFRLFTSPFEQQEIFSDMAPIVLVEPLMKYYELSGDGDALDFCSGIINWAVAPENHLLDEDYRLSGWLRSLAAGLASIVRFATFVGDEKLLVYSDHMFHTAASLTTSFGATPDTEPCCTNMELTTAALALSKAGRGSWWDLVDRHFRNHTLECQFTDPAAIERGYVEGEPDPWDDTRDIIARSIGGFSWSSAREHLFLPRKLMLCCGGNAMWTLGKIVDHAATLDKKGLSINLHFSLDTPLASITNHEPFEGKLEIIPHRDGPVRVRRPAYASRIEAEIDATPIVPQEENSYLTFATARAGTRIVLTYPLPERTTQESTLSTLPAGTNPNSGSFAPHKADPVVAEQVQTTWRGNTVMAIDYDADSPHPKHRLYLHRMESYRKEEGRSDRAAFFIPAKKYDW